MPTVRNRFTLRRTGGSESESLLRVTSINPDGLGKRSSEIKVTNIELQFTPAKPKCPAPPCPYDYWWAPKPPKPKRGQPPPEPKPYINVMADRRVVRGANFGTNFLVEVDPFDRSAHLRRQNALRKIAEEHKCKSRNLRNVIGTVPPVPGRAHLVVQTEQYLEELVARPPAYTAETQTDLFLERPPVPPFKPAKVGVDAATEIGEGELFHFDAEAQPIIEVLVDGAIEQSILNVAHEQELGALRAQQAEFLAKREAELAELRRLEAEEIRLQAEKERRLRQDRIAQDLDMEMQRAVVAAKLLQGHVSSLLPEIWANLEPASDATKKNYLLNSLCPWLGNEVEQEMTHVAQSRDILTSMLAEIIKERAIVYGGYREPVEELDFNDEQMEDEGEGELECCSCDTEISLKPDDDCPPINDKKQ